MRNIAIVMHRGTRERQDQITEFLKSQGYEFWHWIDDLWITQVPDTVTPHGLFTTLFKIHGNPLPYIILLFEIKYDSNFGGALGSIEGWTWLTTRIGRVG